MDDSFIVIGAGGHGKVVVDALLSSGKRVRGVYDDDPSLDGFEIVPGVKVIGPVNKIAGDWRTGMRAIVAVGDNATRRRIALRCEVEYGIAVAPSVVLGRGVGLGAGTMVLPSATLNIDVFVGRHVILNTSCSVDHDCRIGDFAHIGPGCRLGGDVIVGEGSFLGIGATVIPGVRIGRWSVLGSGAVVTADIPDNCTAVGVPARVIKTRSDGWHLA